MARRLADNITSDHLSCPICRDTLTDPRVLPCEHTICLECLTQLIQSSRRFNKFSCPVDRQEITATSYIISAEEWAKSFPPDDLALRLIQTIAGNDTKQVTPKTGVPCSEHPEHFCDFFCFGCGKLVCSECAVERHRKTDCDCKNLSKCRELAREKLRDAYDEIENLISYGQDIVSREFGKDQVLIQSRNRIQNTVFKLKKIVQDFEKMSLRKLVDILGKVDRVADVEKIRERAENVIGELKVTRDEVEGAKILTSTTDILSVLTKIPNKLQRHTDTLYSIGVTENPIELKLELNQSFLKLCDKLVEQSIGTVHVVPADSLDFEETESIVCGQRIKFSSDVLNSRAVELEPFLAIKVEPNDQNNGPIPRFTDLVIHGHSVIAIDNANSKVRRFRDRVENQYIDDVIIPGVYGIAIVHDSDDVIVTAPGKRPRICRLSTYNGLSILVENVTEQCYYNICQLPNEKYAVICHSAPNTRPNKKVYFQWARGVTSHVDIINIDGQILANLSETLLCEPSEFGHPFVMPLKSMCGLPNGNIVVSIDTQTNNFITCVSQSGRVKWTYNLSDIPEGVTCYDDSIYMFLSESKIVRVLSFDGDLKPNSTLSLPNYNGDGNVLLANKNFLTVVDRTDTIRMYHLK